MTTWYDDLPFIHDKKGQRWRLYVEPVHRTWDPRSYPWKRLDGALARVNVIALSDSGEAFVLSANARRKRDLGRLWGRLVRAVNA